MNNLKKMKNLLELKEWSEEKDIARVERTQVLKEDPIELNDYKPKKKVEKKDYKWRKAQEKTKYNFKYFEERVKYLRDRDFKIAYLNLLDPI